MASTSGMSRRIIQRMCTRTSCFWSICMPASFLVGHALEHNSSFNPEPTATASQAKSKMPAIKP